jgi:hypothetical protein
MGRNRVVVIVRVAGVAAVVALAVLLGVRVQARNAREDLEAAFRKQVGSLDPAEYASPIVPDGENAAIWLRSAAAALVLDKDGKHLVGELSWLPAGSWSSQQRNTLEHLIARNAPALDLAERGSTKPRSSFLLSGLEAAKVHTPIPLIDLIWLARLVEERARLAVNEDDWQAFRLSVKELACLGASLERESPLIAQLVGIACERMMAEATLVGVQAPQADRAALDGLDRVIPDVDLVAAWKRALGLMGAGVFSGTVDLHDMLDAGSTKLKVAVPTPAEYMRIVLSVAPLASRPIGLDDALAARLEKTKQLTADRPIGDTLAGSLVRYQSILSLRRVERLAITLRLRALEVGSYPDTLAVWPDASAPDPFTGGALAYERRADGSAVISVPGAESLFNRINELTSFITYTWELPAPGRAAAGGAVR